MFFIKKPEKYSKEWFKSLTDEQLEEEREAVRINPQMRGWYELLEAFDREINRRFDLAHPNEEHIPPAQREHGWYLPNDE